MLLRWFPSSVSSALPKLRVLCISWQFSARALYILHDYWKKPTLTRIGAPMDYKSWGSSFTVGTCIIHIMAHSLGHIYNTPPRTKSFILLHSAMISSNLFKPLPGVDILDFGAIFLTVYLLFRIVSVRQQRSNPRVPPGPNPLPIVGNIFDLPKGLEGPHWAKHKALYGTSNDLHLIQFPCSDPLFSKAP